MKTFHSASGSLENNTKFMWKEKSSGLSQSLETEEGKNLSLQEQKTLVKEVLSHPNTIDEKEMKYGMPLSPHLKELFEKVEKNPVGKTEEVEKKKTLKDILLPSPRKGERPLHPRPKDLFEKKSKQERKKKEHNPFGPLVPPKHLRERGKNTEEKNEKRDHPLPFGVPRRKVNEKKDDDVMKNL